MTAARDADDRAGLQALFPDLAECPASDLMALRPYLGRCPDRFFNRSVYSLMLEWLKQRDRRQRADFRQYLLALDQDLNRAFLFLREVNGQDWHDRPLIEGDDYEVLRSIDRLIHPAYLRLAEAVLAPLIRPVAHYCRLDRGKGTEGLDVYNLAQEVTATPMASCVAAYHHTVRNGIGHGGITYMQSDIRYRDKKGNEETLDVWSIVRLCDDLVDACNGLAAAIKVFLALSIEHGYRLPRELLVEELVEETTSPWWRIEGCMESELGASRQLLVYARPNSRDVTKIQWAGMQSAVLAESLASGYDRYFFSLHSSLALTGWAAFDGTRLRELRESGATEVHEYVGALEETGFFYVPRFPLPRVLGRIDSLVHSLRLQWPLTVKQIRQEVGIPAVVAREAKMHRNGWRYVLNGSVVIPGLENETAASVIRSHKRKIIRSAAKRARSSASWLDIARYLPLGYTRIAVFSHDFRRRRLGGFGLGPQLVCTIQIRKIRRIRSPDIMNSSIETSGRWRIAWNRAWLEAGGRIEPAAK